MNDYLATIMGWAPNFAPRNWAYCQGQLQSIASNQALFSLLGTIYGGDGRTTFALPDLRGRVAISSGSGPGLSYYRQGVRGGTETVRLITTEIPSHNHTAALSSASASIPASSQAGNTNVPSPAVHLAKGQASSGLASNPVESYNNSTPNTALGGGLSVSGSVAMGFTGGNLSHENRQPLLAINWVICLVGLFPSRS